jgi:hypothetical protein
MNKIFTMSLDRDDVGEFEIEVDATVCYEGRDESGHCYDVDVHEVKCLDPEALAVMGGNLVLSKKENRMVIDQAIEVFIDDDWCSVDYGDNGY